MRSDVASGGWAAIENGEHFGYNVWNFRALCELDHCIIGWVNAVIWSRGRCLFAMPKGKGLWKILRALNGK